MNFNTAKIKYVIAREGLIIIFLLFCSGAAYYANSRQTNEFEKYVKDAKEILLLSNPFYKFDSNFDAFTTTKVQFQKQTPTNVVVQRMNEYFSWYGKCGAFDLLRYEITTPTNTHIVARYDAKGDKIFTGFLWNIDFEKIMLFFLLLAYPAYLLVRFIVWASLTVFNKKQKREYN